MNGQFVSLQATTAIMDSGTTAILVSATDAAAIHAVGFQPCFLPDLVLNTCQRKI